MNDPSAQARQTTSPEWRVAAGIGLILAAVYLATGSFHFVAIDEITTFALTRSLLSHGAADTDILAWVGPLMNTFSVTATGLDGHTYSIKDIGPSIIMIPLASLGYLFRVSPVRLVYLLPIFATAFTGSLLYLVIRYMGYRRSTAILGCLVYGFASMAFPYAKVIFTQSVAALGLLVGLWGALRARDSLRPGHAFLSGIGMGLAGLSAAPTWITAPVVLACLALRWGPSGAIRWKKSKEMIRLLLAWGAAASLFAAAQAIYNYIRFGSVLETGHHLIGASMDVSYMGLASWAQLISTPRGVIWFAPFVILIPFSFTSGRRQGRLGLQLICMMMGLLVVLVYSAFFNWSAGLAFGPRYLSMVMPELALVVVPLLDSFLDRMILWRRLLVGAILILSLVTELGGSLFDYIRAEKQMYRVLDSLTPPPGFFAYSPELLSPKNLIQVHLFRAVERGWWDVLWMSRGTPDWPLLAGNLIVIALAAFCLVTAVRGISLRMTRLLLSGQALLMIGLIGWAFGSYPRTAGYSRAPATPSPDLDAAMLQLQQSASPSDGAIVTLFLEENLAWLESPVQVPPDIGLPLEAQLRPTTTQMLDRVPEWHDRVWVISQNTIPGDPQNGIEAWLSQRAFAGAEINTANYRMVPFTFGSGSLSLQPVERSFGDGAITLLGYASELGGPGERGWLNVWLRWEAQKTPSQPETVFVHLLDPGGSLVTQHDGTPQAGYAPTLTWQPGEPVDDRHSLKLPDQLPPGDYSLAVGLYDSVTGAPLPLDGESPGALVLTQLHIGPDAR